MAELPPQGRLTGKTPDEWLDEYMPLLCMLLLGSELVEVVRRRKSESDPAKIHDRAAYARAYEQVGIAWSYLNRLEKCIKSYGSQRDPIGDVDALWRETVRAEYIVPTGDEFGQIFELGMEPKKHFFSKLRDRVLAVLRRKLQEDSHADIDEFHTLLLECWAG